MKAPLRPLARIVLLGLLTPLAAQTIPPYATSYEATGYTLGNLQGQDNWQVTQGSANIVNTLAAEGAQSVQLPASFPLAQITHAFGAPTAGQVAYLDFYVWPSAAGTVNYSTLIDAEGASVGLVRLDAAGHILVFNGDGSGSGRWQVTDRTIPLYPGGQATTWIRFTLRQDYAAKKWDLYVGTRLVAHDLGLRDNTQTHFSLFRLTAALQTNYLDDLYLGEENPLFVDADNDGLEDAWETTHGLNPSLNDRNGDPDADGLTNLAEYQLGTDPDHADTNADGIPDGWLVDHSLDPLGNLAATDPGTVGRTLLQSYQQNLSPWPTPPVSAGLRAWYRADAGVIQDANNQVSQWTDLSGHGFHLAQATATQQPRWQASGPNGQPALSFDASASMLLATNAPVELNAGSHDLTVIAVIQAEASQPVSSTLLDLSWNGGPRGFHWWRGSEATSRFYLGWADVGLNSEQRTPGADAIAGRVQVFTAVKSGTSATDYLDGTVQQTRAVLAPIHQPVARFAVGNTAADSTHGFHGQIAELLVYNRALTPAERATLETTLRSRYINPDSDADGLPDEWEDQQLGTRVYGGNDDPGNVGRTLQQSYQQGSSIWPAPLVGNGLRAWYRADAGVVRDASNQVNRWTDVSGHGFHVLQTIDPSRQPAWVAQAVNGRPAVSYDASGRLTLETRDPADLAAGSNDLTVIAVIQPDPVQPAASTLLDLGRYSGPYGLHWWQEGANANRYYLGWSDASNDSELRSPGLTAAAGRPQVLTVTKNGGSAADYLDGVAQGANTWTATSLRAPSSRLALGNTAGFPTRGFHGQIAEVLVYNRALSETERTDVETALRDKYVAASPPPPPPPPTGDADGNGLPDAWELQYFGRTGIDPAADPDGDGRVNLQENQSGTDPTDFYNGAAPFPFLADFESSEGFTAGSLNGQRGWMTTQGVEINSISATAGVRGVMIPAGLPAGWIDYTPSPTPSSEKTIFSYFYARLVAGSAPADAIIFDLGGARVACVKNDTNGEFYVYDGNGGGSGRWQKIEADYTISVNSITGAADWTPWFGVRFDFVRKRWDLQIDGRVVAIDVGLIDDRVTAINSFTLVGKEGQPVYFDRFQIGADNLAFLDADKDDVDDYWEQRNGLNPTRNDRDDDLDGDGLSNIREALLGLRPDRTDTDGDGLPDAWELAHGYNPSVQDSGYDADGDGKNVLDEYLTGTDPNDYYDGTPPVLAVLNTPNGTANGLITVQVTRPDGTLLVNAPIQFDADADGKLAANPQSTILYDQFVARTGPDGVVRMYYRKP